MFRSLRLWKIVQRELESKDRGTIDRVLAKLDLEIKDLVYIRNKIKASKFIKERPRVTKDLIEILELEIRKLLQRGIEIESLKKKVQFYDFDRFLNKVENKDFKWYLSPKGYNKDQKISLKKIKEMYKSINKRLGKNYKFTGKKNTYLFYELDFETKKVILLYHQLTIAIVINKELAIIKKTNPEIYIPVEFKNDIDTVSLNKIRGIFEKSCLAIEQRLEELRKESKSYEEKSPEIKSLMQEIKHLHNSYSKRINLINQSAALLETYYEHFIQESKWRIIDVLSHSSQGLVYYFGRPLEGYWIWTISSNGEFHLGNRKENLKGGYGQRLPHSTISKGKAVLGAGEVEFVEGKINRFNAQSGHYYDLTNPEEYNASSKKVFLQFAKSLKLKGKKQYTTEALV
tara:strand:- start:15322 stop:16524 length:1203 start_codon:yes stop_codon:yes gene_type:complete